MSMAPVWLTQFLVDKTKLLLPAEFLIVPIARGVFNGIWINAKKMRV
jgi:hypothetical protein